MCGCDDAELGMCVCQKTAAFQKPENVATSETSRAHLRVGFYGARKLGHDVMRTIFATKPYPQEMACQYNGTGWWGTHAPDAKHDVFSIKPDIIVSCLTSHIFTAEEIDATRYGIINLHPAPLPEYRGCNSYSHAIINGEHVYRVTMHYVAPGIDTGPIIADQSVPILPTDTACDLHGRAQIAALQLFQRVWPVILEAARNGKRVPAYRQQATAACYYPRTSLEPYRDLAQHPPQHRERITRALTFPPFPLPRGAA